MKLLCLSDIHGEASGLRAILPDAAQGADMVILAGDLTHLGGYAEAEALLAPLFDVGVRMLAVAGNMEYDGVRRYIGEKKIDIHSPWELADEEARPLLSAGLAAIAEAPFKVLVSHAPPRGTRLDRSFLGQHVGSQAVRDFLDGGAVDLCICGHIHEAAGEEKIGKTLCVNLGPFKNGKYAVLVIQNGQARVDWRKR
jgi:Icc-related predicted phosphoesterase